MYGHKIIVLTDHSALRALLKKENLSDRLYRWAVFLSQYDIDIIHRSGSKNNAADGLSRNPKQVPLSSAEDES
ncbi:MAG: hypothetical protein GY928_39090 [Colwellia sp.]|nr:hypothetical protein [Colwellia sp.]